MKSLVALLCVGALALVNSSPRSDLHGAQVLRAHPVKEADIHYLSALQLQDEYDFWKEPRAFGLPVDIMAKHWQLPGLKEALALAGIRYTVQVADVGTLVQESKMANDVALQESRKEGRAMDWTAFHEYTEIMAWLDSLPTTYPSLATVESAGSSYEGREMKVLKISTGGIGKPVIFVDGGIHAREWIGPAVVTYIVNELLSNFSSYQDVLDKVDIVVMPANNPDGYAFTWSTDRLWRKTRSPNIDSGLGCVGTDPNRNFDFHWMEGGSSSLACSEVYAGSAPFSEVEVRNMRDVMLQYSANLKVYLAYHSSAQCWIYPWGYTNALPDDWQDLDALAHSAVDAITAVYGTTYKIGSSTNVLSLASGCSDDWAKGAGGAKYSYTVELRSQYGFIPPPSDIILEGEESLAGFLVVANFVKNTYGV